MKTIEINHIGKTEGHLSFVGALIDGDFAQARIETQEGARLIEGILLGRKYYEAPIVTSRICGICPIVHNLTSIKAMEEALNIKVTPEIIVLRKILINAQWIHSHALHVFFLSFPDLVGITNNFNFVKKYPKECQLALRVRDFGVQIARIIGGRTVHPINSVVGGFNVEPNFVELEGIMSQQKSLLSAAKNLFEFVAKRELPNFSRASNYVSLRAKGEYPIYDGKIFFSDSNETVSARKFLYDIEEIIIPYEKVKRVKHIERSIMVGALARINNNFDNLNPLAKTLWGRLKTKLPCYNSFYNIFAQVIELVHCLEEEAKLFAAYKKLREKNDFVKRLKIKFKPNPGRGFAVMEAPRGLLYHEYELDKAGTITHVNIIPPTTIFLSNLEKDLEIYLQKLEDVAPKKREQLIKTLIRAYDPCISCATH